MRKQVTGIDTSLTRVFRCGRVPSAAARSADRRTAAASGGTAVRVFLTAWILFSVHFATNIVREFYPAFALVDHGHFRVDEYADFHSDIFVHRDGHAYIGNNVAASVFAAAPLAVFDPLLDALEARSKSKLVGSGGAALPVYRSEYPRRRELFRKAAEHGLELRFGAAAAVTSVFLMAPLSAACVVLMYHILTVRGVVRGRAVGLALLLGFGTPIFFRTSTLGHNLFVMYASFLAFFLLWVRPEMRFPVSVSRRLAAGFLGGLALALDYSGFVPLLVLYGYLLFSRVPSAGSFWKAWRESLAYVAGSVPPVAFLLWSQWAMYGNLFLPGQYWMPAVNYTDRGFRGFDWPSLDLFYQNLFHPAYGMYAFGPILALGLVPAWWYRPDTLIVPRRERRWIAVYVLAFLLFCAANQYSYMQWNTGFRYLLPVVPVVFCAACDHLARLPRAWLIAIAVPVLVHSWVLTAVRKSVPESWSEFLATGVRLPWVKVLQQSSFADGTVLASPLVPAIVLAAALGLVAAVWLVGRRRSDALSP